MNFFFSDRVFIFHEFLKKVLIICSDLFDQLCSELLHFVSHVSRDIHNIKGRTMVFIMPYNRTVFHQVYNTFEVCFVTYWKYDWNCIRSKHFFYLLTNVQEVSSLTVHFVYEAHTSNFVIISKSPVGFRLRFNPIYCREKEYKTIKYTKRTVYLYGKVNVSRCIDDVEVIVFGIRKWFALLGREFPVYCNSSGSNGDPSFSFLLHPVGSSTTFVSFTNFVVLSGIK